MRYLFSFCWLSTLSDPNLYECWLWTTIFFLLAVNGSTHIQLIQFAYMSAVKCMWSLFYLCLDQIRVFCLMDEICVYMWLNNEFCECGRWILLNDIVAWDFQLSLLLHSQHHTRLGGSNRGRCASQRTRTRALDRVWCRYSSHTVTNICSCVMTPNHRPRLRPNNRVRCGHTVLKL